MVSIIIPAYNAEKYITETIESVLNQTFTDWELIIVIDGATDHTEDIARSFESDERISVIVKENTGVSDTRNIGMSKAKGNYIALLDADDIWLPENLEKKITFLEQNSEFGWVYSQMNEFHNDTSLVNQAPRGHDKEILKSILSWKGEVVPGPCSNVVFRSEFLKKGLAFDVEFSTAADQDFTLQLAQLAPGKLIDEYLWNYRVLSGSMSRNIAAMEKDHIGVFNKAASNNLFLSASFKRKCFANLYLILAGSWWKNGQNRTRGLYFLFRSFFTHPKPLLSRILGRS